MLRRIAFLPLILLLFSVEATAQYDPSYSHYWAMETAYNPAAVGKQDKINVNIAYNMSMAGFKRNPRTMYFSGDMPFYALGTYHGVGGQFVSDQIGLFAHNRFSAQYAFRQKLFGGYLAVGVQGTMISESFDGSKLDVEQSGDLALSSSNITGSGFDLGVGVYYKRKSWYAGASVQHVLGPTIRLGETNELNISQTYYLTAGCNIRLRNPFLTLQPSVFGRSDGVGYRADMSCRLRYSYDGRVMYAGLGYSPSNSATIYLGGLFHGVMLGYSYEVYTSAISPVNGSHELFVGYQTDMNLFKKGRNRHQSVRIL